jgi:hypothetical protein
MSDYFILLISENHARFFTLEPVEFPELESGPRLIERGDMVNIERGIAKSELFTDSKTGRGRAPRGGRAHGYDDHRSRHEDEFNRAFVREILEKTSQLAKTNKARIVIVAASARMLGFVRPELGILTKQGLEMEKLSKDMIKFTPKEIHDYLAKKQLLPTRRKRGS